MSVLSKLADALAGGNSSVNKKAASALADSASSSAKRVAKTVGDVAEKARTMTDDASNVVKNRAKQLATDAYIKRFSNLGGDIIGQGKSLTDTLGRNLWDRLAADKVGVTNLEDYATNQIKPLSKLYSDVLDKARETGTRASVNTVRDALNKNLDSLSVGQSSSVRKAMKDYLSNLDTDLLGKTYESIAPQQKAVASLTDQINALNDEISGLPKSSRVIRAKELEDVADKTLKEKQSQLRKLGQQRSTLNKQIQNALDSATIDYDDLRKIRQTVKSKASDIAAQGINATADDKALQKFYNEMAKDLDDVIDTGLANFGQEMGLRQNLINALTESGADPSLIKQYMEAADDAVNISTIRKEMSPYMFAKDVLDESRRGLENAADLGGVLGKVGNIPVVGEAINRIGEAGNVGKQKLYEGIASGAVGETTKKALNLAKKAGIGLAGASVLSQLMGGNGSGQDIAGEYAQANNTNAQGVNQPTSNAGSAMAQIMGGSTAPTSTAGNIADSEEYINALLYGTALPTGSNAVAPSQTLGGYTLDEYRNAYIAALLDGNTYMANIYKNVIDQFDTADDIDTQLDRQYKQLQIQQLQQKLNDSGTSTGDAKKEAALNTLQSLMNNYEAQGWGGYVTNLLNSLTQGAYNPKVFAYESGVKGSLGSIIKALGDSGALSEGDQKRALDLIPKTTDSPQAARTKYQQLMNILQTSANNDTFIIAQ